MRWRDGILLVSKYNDILNTINIDICVLCWLLRRPRYYRPPVQRPRRYQPPPRPHPAEYSHYDDYYDDAWTSDSGFHSARPPRREPYYYDYYDYGYDARPPQKPSRPNADERPPRPNSLSMDDMMKEAKEYSGKTRGLADMVDDLHGVTYGDKIVGEFLGKLFLWSLIPASLYIYISHKS